MKLDERMTIFSPARIAARDLQLEVDKGTAEDAKLRKATEDFEALLIGQMLQSVRESARDGWQENHDQPGAVALEMAETHLAQAMAAQGGLGIARNLQSSMTQRNQRTEAQLAPSASSS
jgi:Rod binding domain-containing protein